MVVESWLSACADTLLDVRQTRGSPRVHSTEGRNVDNASRPLFLFNHYHISQLDALGSSSRSAEAVALCKVIRCAPVAPSPSANQPLHSSVLPSVNNRRSPQCSGRFHGSRLRRGTLGSPASQAPTAQCSPHSSARLPTSLRLHEKRTRYKDWRSLHTFYGAR
jgi:hypothetical protein